MMEEGGVEGENMSMGKLGVSQAGRGTGNSCSSEGVLLSLENGCSLPTSFVFQKFIEFPLVSVFYLSTVSTLFTAVRTLWGWNIMS